MESAMSFRERSAWVMAAAVLLGAGFYVWATAGLSAEIGRAAPPLLPVIAALIVLMTAVAIFGHAIVVALAPKDADPALDERDRLVMARAGAISACVFATGVVCALGWYLVTRDGDALFHFVFASLFAGQFAEYVLQILFYRRA
jgi:hypothetical protein